MIDFANLEFLAQMLVIDQSEARYAVGDAMFISKAEEKVEPFKVGDSQFWKASGRFTTHQTRLEALFQLPIVASSRTLSFVPCL